MRVEQAVSVIAERDEAFALAMALGQIERSDPDLAACYDLAAIAACLTREMEPTIPIRLLSSWWRSDAVTGAMIGPAGVGKTISAIRLALHGQRAGWRICGRIKREEIESLSRARGLLVLDEACGPLTDHAYTSGLVSSIVTHRHDAGLRTLLLGNATRDSMCAWIDGAQADGRLLTRLGRDGWIDCTAAKSIRGRKIGGPRSERALLFLAHLAVIDRLSYSHVSDWTPRARLVVERLGLQDKRDEIEHEAREIAANQRALDEALQHATKHLEQEARRENDQ